MLRTLLLYGLIAGACAGLLAAGFAFVVGEPYVDRAIAFEEQLAHSTGEAHEHEEEIVSRDVQRTGGLLIGTTVYGLAVGGLFALAFAALYGRVGRGSPARTALWLAAGAFVVVSLVPFLKYPANPPAVGREETIGTRTELYVAMIAISILAAVAALRLGRWLTGRFGQSVAIACAIGAFVVVVTAAGLALPGVDEVPAGFPGSTLWKFRLASLGTQLVLWSTIGVVFAFAAQRFMNAYRPSGLDAPSVPTLVSPDRE